MRNEMSAEVVSGAAALLKKIDDNLAETFRDAEALTELVEQGITEGMIPRALVAKSILWEARSLPGAVADLAERFAEFHKAGQKIAAEAREDTPPLERVGGIVLPAGGTR